MKNDDNTLKDTLRREIRVGDYLYLRIPEMTDNPHMGYREARVQVVAKYPELVEVQERQVPSLPVRTITYAEMLMTENRYMFKGNKRLRALVS